MVNIRKQIDYWRQGAGEDWAVGAALVKDGKVRHGLFFVHLAVEKALKAHVCRATEELAPRIHDLPRLARLGRVTVGEERLRTLAELNTHNLEGRYPGDLLPALPREEAGQLLDRAGEVLEWLTQQL